MKMDAIEVAQNFNRELWQIKESISKESRDPRKCVTCLLSSGLLRCLAEWCPEMNEIYNWYLHKYANHDSFLYIGELRSKIVDSREVFWSFAITRMK